MADAGTGITTAELEAYLAAELDLEVAEIEVFDRGLNLNVAISTEDEENAYMLRRPNKLRHTELFNDLESEYRLLERLHETDVPTPVPVLFCDDASILGEPFFVTTHLDGAAIPMGSPLDERFPTADARASAARRLIDTLADVHTLDAEPFGDACKRLTTLDQVERATDRLGQVTDVTGRDVSILRNVADWLRENPPSEPRTALLHGDFKPGNVLFVESDRPEVSGVLDWEAALLGDPLTELGYFLLYWRDESDPTPSLDDIEARYDDEAALRELRALDENGFYPFTTAPGSPSRRELVSRYEDRTGVTFENERFYRAHAVLMLATVWEDLHRREVEAGEESIRGPLLDYTAMVAERIVSGEFRL